MHLAVGEALFAALDLFLPALELVLPGQEALLDLRDPGALFADLALDLGPEPHRFFARLDLGLAANRLGFPARIRDARPSEEANGQEYDGTGDQSADQNCRNRRAWCSSGPCPRGLRFRMERSERTATNRARPSRSNRLSTASVVVVKVPLLVGSVG